MRSFLIIVCTVMVLCFSSIRLYSADYFWIGGTGSWSDINHWATTSGGVINYFQVPTPFDDVIFDANSFLTADHVVTVDAQNSVCRDMTWTNAGNTPTFTGSYTIRIYGSLTLIPAMNWNYNGSVSFESTTPGKTITTAGKNFASVSFQGVGGGWSLNDELNISGNFSLAAGSFNTNNHNVNCWNFSSYYSSVRVLTLGSSVITCNSSYGQSSFYLYTNNLTLNAGTSTIIISGNTTSTLAPRTVTTISGSAPIAFYNIETTNTNSNCFSYGDLYWNIQAKTTIHKLTISGKQFHLLNNVYNAKIIIDSLLITGDCGKTFDDSYILKINEIICSNNPPLLRNSTHKIPIKTFRFNGNCVTLTADVPKFQR